MDFLDLLLDALIDTLKSVPFLFLAYLFMEFLEHKASNKMASALNKVGPASPVVGSLLGCVPQCGFSASASNLYTAGVVSEGALLAIFLATSDEALPVLISNIANPTARSSIWKFILCKVAIGIVAGFALNFILKMMKVEKTKVEMCENCGCDDEEGILKPSLIHTAKTSLFILIVNLVLGLVIMLIGMERLEAVLLSGHLAQPFITALVGLIPNCAVSVALTELYISGSLSFGSAIAGLCSGAGIGLAVLIKSNKNKKENIRIILTLYFVSALFGFLLMLFGVK